MGRALQNFKSSSVLLCLTSLQDLLHLADGMIASFSLGHQQASCELVIVGVKLLAYTGAALVHRQYCRLLNLKEESI